jgi:hypothetical protein
VLGQIELSWVQNGPVGFGLGGGGQKIAHQKTINPLDNENFVSKGLQRTNRKIVSQLLYTTENFEEKVKLGTFCTNQ